MTRASHHIKRLIARWTGDEQGVAATEYAILLALIILVSVGAIGMVGGRIAGLYAVIEAAMPAGFLS